MSIKKRREREERSAKVSVNNGQYKRLDQNTSTLQTKKRKDDHPKKAPPPLVKKATLLTINIHVNTWQSTAGREN